MCDDDILAGYLRRRDPCEFEAFLDFAAQKLMEASPAAYRQVSSFRHVMSLDDVIGRSMEHALNHLRRQFGGQKSFAFDPDIYGLTFQKWFLRIVGHPYRGTGSGVAGTEFNRVNRANLSPLDEQKLSEREDKADDYQRYLDRQALEVALNGLDARPQFVVRALSGIHGVGVLHQQGIVELASTVRLLEPSRRIVGKRARILFQGTKRFPSTTLTAIEVGHVLELGPSQIHNIKNGAYELMRAQPFLR